MPIFCQIHFGLAFPKLSLRSENYILQNTDENLLKLNCSKNGWITAYRKKSLHFQGNTTAYISTQQLLVHGCPFTPYNFFKKQNTVKSPAIYLVLKYISSQFEKSLCLLFYGKSARGWIPILTSWELFTSVFSEYHTQFLCLAGLCSSYKVLLSLQNSAVREPGRQAGQALVFAICLDSRIFRNSTTHCGTKDENEPCHSTDVISPTSVWCTLLPFFIFLLH